MARLRLRRLLAAAALATAWGLAGAGERDHEDARALRAQGAIVALEDVLRSALALHAGRVVEVELKRRHDALQYEVEIVDDGGQVWELRFDARTGTLVREERDR